MFKPFNASPSLAEPSRSTYGDGLAAISADGADVFSRLDRELEALIADSGDPRGALGDLRQRMDGACDEGRLTIKQWRALIDKVSAARANSPTSSRERYPAKP